MPNIVAEQNLDGGYSGEITVSRRRPIHPDVNPDMVLVESESLGHLVLSTEGAKALVTAVGSVLGEPVDDGKPYLVTIAEAARLLSATPWPVLQLCDQGVLPSVYIGARCLIPRQAVRDYAANVTAKKRKRSKRA